MNRRSLGLVVLVVAVFAAVAGTARDKVVSGSAQAAPFVGAPAVGDCVLAPIPAAGPDLDGPGPALDAAPCTGQRYGEVVAVAAAQLPTSPTGTTDAAPESAYAATCGAASLTYLGLVRATDGGPTPMATNWYPMPLGRSVYYVATAHPPKGRPWVACVLAPSPVDDRSTVAYTGTARGAAGSGRIPGEFGSCVSTADEYGDMVDCSTPHPTEILGYTGPLASPPSRAELNGTCRLLATRLTGLADPTAGGKLQVVLAPQAGGWDSAGRDTVLYQCRLAAAPGTQLVGPLVGIGEGPVPVR